MVSRIQRAYADAIRVSVFVAVVAFQSSANGAIVFETELTTLNLVTTTPVQMPLASDPGNALGDSASGYGFVNSQVTVTLSSQRLISPGPRSLGTAVATNDMSNGPNSIDPEALDGQLFSVNSFFDVFFDLTLIDVDARPGRDYFGGTPALTFQNVSLAGSNDLQTNYSAIFDKDAPGYGLFPPREGTPYIGNFNLEIPVGGDVNGNGEEDKIKLTLMTLAFDDEGRTFIVLPDGTVVDSMNASASISGAVVDVSSDPPFTIGMLNGPTTAQSQIVVPSIPEASGLAMYPGAGRLVLMPTVVDGASPQLVWVAGSPGWRPPTGVAPATRG